MKIPQRQERFKFRVWDKSSEHYVPRSQFILLSDGTLIQEIGAKKLFGNLHNLNFAQA